MSDDATGFVGSIPEYYDRGLGPIIFADYAEHTAALSPVMPLPACWRPAPGPA
jgi:hypothetical protein